MVSILAQAAHREAHPAVLAVHGGPKVRPEPFPSHPVMWTAGAPRAPLEVASLEDAFGSWLGGHRPVAAASGVAAWRLTVSALDLAPGDEVILPPTVDAASVHALAERGATPVFADLDPITYGLDPREVERRITPRTRAVAVQHLFGRPADLDALLAVARRARLALIEDCRQACGATYRGRRVGRHGDLACFSLHAPGQDEVTGCGLAVAAESGANDHLRRARDASCSSGPPAAAQVSAALAILARLDQRIARRQQLSDLLAESVDALPGLNAPPLPAGGRAAPEGFPIVVDTRRVGVSVLDLVAAVAAEGIPVAAGQARPVYLAADRPQARDARYRSGLCPVAERLPGRLFTVPLDERLTERDLHDIVASIRKVTSARWLPLLLRLPPAGYHLA